MGSVCSPCMEQPPVRRWVSHVLAFQRSGAEQYEVVRALSVLRVQVLGAFCPVGSLFGVTFL